jgi:hypothetical protein
MGDLPRVIYWRVLQISIEWNPREGSQQAGPQTDEHTVAIRLEMVAGFNVVWGYLQPLKGYLRGLKHLQPGGG